MIFIGCDHGGFEIKEKIRDFLEENGAQYRDLGTNGLDSVDYPEFAEKVAKAVVASEGNLGILVCGTGIGVCIAANKIKGTRAALCHNVHYAQMARRHNNANVLCLGGRELSKEEVIDIVKAFLNTDFEGGRHQKRVLQIAELEKQQK